MKLLIFTLFFLLHGAAWPQVLTWESLASHKIQIEAHASAEGEVLSSYIPYFIELGHYLWSWDPKKNIKNKSGSIYIQASAFDNLTGLNEKMKSLFVSFDVSNAQNFRKLWFKPTADLKFRGLLGLHDFKKKRPLVILRMGIHGNVDEIIAERFLAKLIYEDLDANFLMLESLTSHAFLSKNTNISFGGVDEGLQTFLVLNEISKSKLNLLVSDIHVVSVSMGAHGTFVTALLDQLNGHKIKSILSFCPLINLQATLESRLNTNFKNAAIDLWNAQRLSAIFNIYHDEVKFNDWWKTIFDLKPRFTPALLEILNRDRKRALISPAEIEALIPNMKWPKDFKFHLENSKSFFALNNFWPHYQNVKTPMMIYTTPKDPLVINELNAELIFRGQQPGDFSNLKYHRLERGLHCGLASVYQWDYLVKLFKDGLEL